MGKAVSGASLHDTSGSQKLVSNLDFPPLLTSQASRSLKASPCVLHEQVAVRRSRAMKYNLRANLTGILSVVAVTFQAPNKLA